jgi:DNA replication protein DnaC
MALGSDKRAGAEWVKARDKIYSVLDADRGSLIALVGKRGTGKTQMSVDAAVVTAYRKPCIIKYCKIVEFYFAVKATFESRDTEQSAILQFVHPELLILDEIQEKADSDWSRRLLTYLIDRRYDKMKHTILIGNVDPPGPNGVDPLIECIGDSAYSRMIETGCVIRANWSSYRNR